MKEILAHFQQSLDDNQFSRAETKALRKILKDYAPNTRQLAILRRRLFEMGSVAITPKNTQQIMQWLENSTKLILEASRREPISNKAYFSPGRDCLNAIIFELKHAKETIDICVFTITDNRITKAIIAAQKRGVGVRIITDNDKSEDEGSDVDRLSQTGLAVKIDQTQHHMHHKYAIIDGRHLISGSYNWTVSAARFNNENIVITNDLSLIQQFSQEFEKLWKKCKNN